MGFQLFHMPNTFSYTDLEYISGQIYHDILIYGDFNSFQYLLYIPNERKISGKFILLLQ